MKYNGSNFFYLKKNYMEKYYDELVKAECICQYYPRITKIIVRKVLEVFLKDIAKEEFLEDNLPVWSLFQNIKLNSSISLPKEICNYIEIILANGYEDLSHDNKYKRISRNSEEVLEMMHNILCWYIKKMKLETVVSIKDLSFRAPSTIDYIEKQVAKINEDILEKDKLIYSLRQRIINEEVEYNNIRIINNTIIEIKEEKNRLEKVEILLKRKIDTQKQQVADMEKNHKTYLIKCDELRYKGKESQELLLEKESQLVKVEIQRQELKSSINEFDDRDESIASMENHIDMELTTIRKTYENLLNLTNEYQDILETIEFSYDKDLQEILEAKKRNIRVKMNFEDGIFNENIIECTRNIIEIKRKISIFKEIVNEKIKREIKYDFFYRGFLGLEGKELRVIYAIIRSSNITSNLLDKSKELFLKSNEEKFLESVSKNLQKYKNINDDEIKLILYYKLIKLSKVPVGKIYNRKQFIKNLNSIVDRAYEVLIIKKDFKIKAKKIDSIIAYYLERVVLELKNKSNHHKISDDLAKKIYNKIIELRQNSKSMGNEKSYGQKFDVWTMSEIEFEVSVKNDPCTFLLIMIDLGDFYSYKAISEIIYETYNVMVKKVSEQDGKALPTKFYNGYFMLLLLLSSETVSSNQKRQEDLIPLLVAEIASTNFLLDGNIVDLQNYNKIVSLWKHKQQNYNDIFIQMKENESVLESIIKEKNELEGNDETLLKTYNTLSQKYSSYKDEFKKIIMSSEKRVLLPSYLNYDELKTKKEKAENNINKSIDKLGTLKSIVSPSMWREKASKLINESNMEEAEKQLIEESKQKPYFRKEYSVILDLEEQINKTNELIKKNKEDIKDKELLIDNIKVKIEESRRNLNNIKEVYLDMQEGYY